MSKVKNAQTAQTQNAEVRNSVTAKFLQENLDKDYIGHVANIRGVVVKTVEKKDKWGNRQVILLGGFKVTRQGEEVEHKAKSMFLPNHIADKLAVGELFDISIERVLSEKSPTGKTLVLEGDQIEIDWNF